MRAILNNDVIVKLCSDNNGVEIGKIPRGVGLERLRFDGKKIIDLADLTEMWVDKNNILHAVKVPGSKLVQMTYNERKHLINDEGTVRVKTPQERLLLHQEEAKAKIHARRKQHYPDIGDQLDELFKWIDKENTLPDGLREVINKWKQVKENNPIPQELK